MHNILVQVRINFLVRVKVKCSSGGEEEGEEVHDDMDKLKGTSTESLKTSEKRKFLRFSCTQEVSNSNLIYRGEN